MRVVGFGACMINGVPFKPEDSFFQKFIENLENNGTNIDFSKVISLEGFTINRAKKYFSKKVLSLNPDLVILQFGSTDCFVDLKKNLYKNFKIMKKFKNQNGSKEISKYPIDNNINSKLTSICKFIIKLLLIKLFNSTPRTTLNDYIESLEYIINECNSLNIELMILSPFVIGDIVSNMYAKKYTMNIYNLNHMHSFIFVNCHSLLIKHNIQDVLLKDGVHISTKSHLLIADLMFKEYIKSSHEF